MRVEARSIYMPKHRAAGIQGSVERAGKSLPASKMIRVVLPLLLRLVVDAMRILVCRCPETHQPVSLQLYTDYVTLARIWSNSVRFQCPHCGAQHETKVGAACLEDTLARTRTSSSKTHI